MRVANSSGREEAIKRTHQVKHFGSRASWRKLWNGNRLNARRHIVMPVNIFRHENCEYHPEIQSGKNSELADGSALRPDAGVRQTFRQPQAQDIKGFLFSVLELLQ